MLQPQDNRYLPAFVLLALIITLQSFLIGEDQRQSDFDRPAITFSNTFSTRTGSPASPLVELSRADYARRAPAAAPAPVVQPTGAPRPQPTVASSPPACTTTCEVDFGDNIWRISKRYGVSTEEIVRVNHLAGPALTPGQVLLIPVPCGPTIPAGYESVRARPGESAIDVATRVGVPLIDLVRENDLPSLYDLPTGTVLKYRRCPPEPHRSAQPRSSPRRESSERHVWLSPLAGRYSDRFGWRRHPIHGEVQFHTGVDIQGRHGEPIRAAQDGRVVFAGWMTNYGRTIVLRHANGLTTRYAHCSFLLKKPGDAVRRGEKIARVGTSGVTTGPHVHFEVRVDGKPINPTRYIGRWAGRTSAAG